METINLSKKTIVNLDINGVDHIAVFDNLTIENFQKTYKKGFLKVYDEIKKAQDNGDLPITSILQLLGSIIRNKKTGQIVGYKFLNQFDTMATVKALSPIIPKVIGGNLPEPKGESEKK